MTATHPAERARAPDDHDHAEHEATLDHDLPAAEGGVETPRRQRRATRTNAGES